MGFTITHTIEISDQRVGDLICSGVEGGIGYWCGEIKYVTTLSHEPKPSEYTWEYVLRGGEAKFYVPDYEDEWFSLTREKCEHGLALLRDKYPQHFLNFVDETDDADTGDVFIQCCLFGELVFG